MSKFHRLTNNESDFPNVENIDVYQFDNDFDYSRYDSIQMELQICTVPWDMGEAHIGNRIITGIGNVVYFGSKHKRDEWFDAIPERECYRFFTKYKDLHRSLDIDVPIPFDMCAKHNYLRVQYAKFANEDSCVEYEQSDGLREWFWFIREVEYLAPNTTRLHLLDDAFQTWIYDVDVSGMILERGHAPMYSVGVDDYLSNPIENASMLLAEDVNFGSDYIARSSSEFIFNSANMYALIVTTANVKGTWGTKMDSNWKCPGNYNFQMQGIPSYYAFAMKASDLSAFITNVNDSYPQFIQTVKAIAFVSKDLITLSKTAFTFADVSCYDVSGIYKKNTVTKIGKNDFGYDSRYAEIAKLYTYPYAYLIVTDEQGNQTEIHVESTNGTIEFESTVSLVFPWLTINGHLSGIGKTPAKSISFANVNSLNMPIQGNWYDYLLQWNIPTFGIIQDAGTNNDYGTFYDRKQQQTAIDNQYLNVQESADTTVDNADLTAATNTSVTTISNTSCASGSDAQQLYNTGICAADNNATGTSATATTAANEQQAAISAASGVASGVMGAVGSLATGNPVGAVSAIVGAGIGAASTMASSNVAISLTNTQSSITQTANLSHATLSNAYTVAKSNIQQSTQTGITGAQNDLTTGSAANTAAMMLANAGRDKATGESAIANQIAQASIGQPMEFGAWNYGDLASSRPMGLFANVVTQSDFAISNAGDEFLRYGYMYGKYWNFNGDWNIGKYYTYWKLKDFWVSNLNVPDMYMDKLRFFLFGGVTVWRKPEYIGHVSIYDNI